MILVTRFTAVDVNRVCVSCQPFSEGIQRTMALPSIAMAHK